MNKVLLICSNFLPIRDGGSIRGEKLVKYLPLFGWDSIVLTKKNHKTNRSFDKINNIKIFRTRKLDLASFLFRVKTSIYRFFIKNKNIEIVNTSIIDKSQTNKRRLSQYILLPDADIFWALRSVFKCISIIKKEKPNAIISTSPNHSVHIVGFLLKKIFNIHWVVEFRDPWTMNPFNTPKPFKFLNFLDNFLEKIILKNSDIINVTSVEYKDQFIQKYPFLDSTKITNIPNGYDPEDFDIELNEKNNIFTIVHTGNFYQQRSSVQFIESIIYLFENNIIKEDTILIKFIGIVDERGIQLINSSKFKKSFQINGFLDHHKCIKEIKLADLLLLIPGPGIGTMPGKFYEYLAAGKPIFCISNEGPTKRYIEDYGLGQLSSNYNIKIIAKNLNIIIKKIQNNQFKYPDTKDLMDKFSRKNIAKDMAKILDKYNCNHYTIK